MSVQTLDAVTEQLPAVAGPGERPPPRRDAGALLTCAAAFLSTTAAAWMSAGVFRGGLARAVAPLGPLVGAGLVAASYRTRRPTIVQYLALPAGVVVGAALVLPDASGGTANLPGLVAEAIRTGGLSQPPIAFDPGWRFLLVVLPTIVAAAAASLATGLNRPKLGVFVPVPLLFAAALVQPRSAAMQTSLVSLVLMVGALGVAYGVDLARDGATSGRFELRRLGRGAGVAVALVAVLVPLSRAGFLFPDVQRRQVVPPKRPEVQRTQADRLLFTVSAEQLVPWRLGVLDTYDGTAWLLPPYDTGRLEEVPPDGTLRRAERVASGGGTISATFVLADVEGHVIPTVANPQRVRRSGFGIQYDPRTQMLRLPERRASRGMTYTVRAAAPPAGDRLASAPEASVEFQDFLAAPPPPREVTDLLTSAPTTSSWDRLQFVRQRFYESVVAQGAGNPVDLPPERVAEMLSGKPGSPFEITAAEALLARWAGVPARIGYGFYGGDSAGERRWSVHPRHGATWLEAHFEELGWVPIVGVPPRAKASLRQQQKNVNPDVRPTDELALVVYVPIKLQSVQLLFVTVRYWLAVTLPPAAVALAAWWAYPGVLKALRRLRRRRWARERGLRERITVAYAEFRDVANDLNVGDIASTPLEFVRAVHEDAEHLELAWLATRAMWGDLARDLRSADAEAAEDMAASVARRLARAQPFVGRALAFGSRVSLRDPYSPDVPNLWPGWASERGAARRMLIARLAPLRRLRRFLPFVSAMVACALVLSACAREVAPTGRGEPVLPARMAPDSFDGFSFAREEKAETSYRRAGRESLVHSGRVYTIRRGDDVLGSLQVASFKPGYTAQQPEVRDGVLRSIGAGAFRLTRIGTERIHTLKLAEQTIFVWFPPGGRYFELVVARQGFDRADRLFASILAYQRGEQESFAGDARVPPLDPRRGGDP